ncbi:MAG: GAF domain-containing protein [Anaerolineales bacterium]|nr:GAF domain-containing protein [Anaerolineales bacterium]
MVKKNTKKKRIDELFSDAHLPNPEPGPEAAQARPVAAADEPVAPVGQDPEAGVWSTEDLLPSLRDRLGWEEFLNAIDRNERIGFRLVGDELQPYDDLPGDEGGDGYQVPLQIGDQIFGALQLEAQEDLSPEARNLLASVAQQVAQHVENLRLLAQAEQYRAEAEQVTRRITHAGWEAYMQLPNAPSSGYVYDLNKVQPMASEDVDGFVSVADPGTWAHDLKVRDEPIGRLAVAEARQAPETVTSLLGTIAERLSVHIENLRLLDETERSRQQLDKRAAELETVAQVSTAAATIRDPQALLQSVVDLTNYSFGLYHTDIYLVNEAGNALELAAASGKIGQEMVAKGHLIPFYQSRSIIAKAARTKEIILVKDARQDPDFLADPNLPQALSEMAIPMIVGDELVGVFDVEADVVERFDEEDKRTYNTLAAQTAVALRNAQLYEEQLQTVERLRELDHLKSAFLANMSHELRTPLNSILGFTQVMLEGLDGPLTEDMDTDLQLIEKNGQHLLNLINDVLDMAKIEAGRVSLSLEPLMVNDLLNEILKTTSGVAREKALDLELQSELPDELTFMVDAVRLRQVLINLVGNAAKFTEQGGIVIRAEQIQERVRIRIQDTGIGIPPSKLESIFEAFSQVDTSTTRKTGGTGLGLPISRRLVELHGGRLWAESSGVPGEGSTFFLELPLEQHQAAEAV